MDETESEQASNPCVSENDLVDFLKPKSFPHRRLAVEMCIRDRSGGERQRLSIARAFLKDAPIILLDEATASLDVENETMIQESLSKLIQNKTVMIIAHRMRTVSGADKIVVLSEGAVAQQGSPDVLGAQDGIYSHMVALQQQSGAWKME